MSKKLVVHQKIDIIYKDQHLWTTSLDVAEKFGKIHKNVLRDIEKLGCPHDFHRLNFEPISYSDSYGREQKAYEMTRDGFVLLAMGFTGKRAMHWKIEWQQARLEGKMARRSETDAIQRFVEYAQSQGSSKPQWYYKHITNATYKALGFIEKSLPKEPIRELIDQIGLSNLTTAEYMVARELERGMYETVHYKEVFQNCKIKLEQFAAIVGKRALLTA